MVKALEAFKKAAEHDPLGNPLSFVNAARTYQQLGQNHSAKLHLDHALALDPSLSMTYVDMSQNLLQSGKTEEALGLLNHALRLAKHVSEIRDVMTARKVATIQRTLEEKGLFYPPSDLPLQAATIA